MTTKTILLIDDELNVREVVELCLKDLAGWNVITAESPLDGLFKAALAHPDAIVLDLSIRGMNSLRFMNQLRSNPETQAIPVVVLSAKARWIDSQILQQYQVAGIILKPFDPVTLPIQIRTMLGWDFMPICD
ncbi:response regulator [Nostocaceae cyanobacterium CENA357]|uniref:Response regulator n=1 Tax=Atlanticothrix silvestris CENA357 TaxID=1725252 RepID=A0A8J7HKF1_9CYAN|nr:response regulator [Atlanticothrix silvestris]MBH8554629.1 response regulator [Atlanticothrix silvestris CENA357]